MPAADNQRPVKASNVKEVVGRLLSKLPSRETLLADGGESMTFYFHGSPAEFPQIEISIADSNLSNPQTVTVPFQNQNITHGSHTLTLEVMNGGARIYSGYTHILKVVGIRAVGGI